MNGASKCGVPGHIRYREVFNCDNAEGCCVEMGELVSEVVSLVNDFLVNARNLEARFVSVL